MAYNPNVIVGSTLTDLGRNAVESEALNVKKQLESAAQFYQLQARKADLEARRTEADKDRALRFFEVGQQKSLKERELDLEDKRLQTEASRWAQQFETNTGLKKQELGLMEKEINTRYGAGDPRMAVEVERTRAYRQEANKMAENAARDAQRQIDAAFSKLSKEKTPFNVPIFGKGGTELQLVGRQKAAEFIQQEELPKIRASLLASYGEPASMVQFIPETSPEGYPIYRAVANLLPEVTTQPASSQPTLNPFGPQPPPPPPGAGMDMGAIPWTLIGADNKVHTFATKGERDAALRAMQGESAPALQSGGYLRFDPQTGTFR